MSKTKFLLSIGACGLFFFAMVCGAHAQEEEFHYDSGGQRNPFMPLVSAEGRLLQLERKTEAARGDVALEGIIYDPYGVSYAIVNRLVVKIGDYVGDSQVLKIEKNKVMFIEDGQITELELKKEARREEKD